jgi:hypothetical protein
LNYLIAKGGFEFNDDSIFSVNFDKIEQAVSDLTRDILILQGDGDKAAVDAFVNKYATVEPATRVALDRIDHAGKWQLNLKAGTSIHLTPFIFRHPRGHSSYLYL